MSNSSDTVKKNIYRKLREEKGITRSGASDKFGWISQERLERIESEKVIPRTEFLLKMVGNSRLQKARSVCVGMREVLTDVLRM